MSRALSAFSRAVWQGVGGRKAGSDACRCPRPVSRPPAAATAAGGEGQASRIPCSPDEGTHRALPGTFITRLQFALGPPGLGEQPGEGGRLPASESSLANEKSSNSAIYYGEREQSVPWRAFSASFPLCFGAARSARARGASEPPLHPDLVEEESWKRSQCLGCDCHPGAGARESERERGRNWEREGGRKKEGGRGGPRRRGGREGGARGAPASRRGSPGGRG